MNFLDTYEITGSNTPPRQPEQSLNEEVTQVIGQLGRFWGGFRKQVCILRWVLVNGSLSYFSESNGTGDCEKGFWRGCITGSEGTG